MNKFSAYKYVVFGMLLLLVSCETDFTTISDYKDITVVYGLLDQKDSMQYIKINKAFLSEGNVLEYAQNADCTNYAVPLEVTLEEVNDAGNVVNTFDFDTTSVYNKEPGTFYYPDQLIYRWQKPQYPYDVKYIIEGLNDTVGVEYLWLNEADSYRLKIKNPVSEKEITAETVLIKDFDITKPGYGTTINFIPNAVSPIEFSWNQAENGGLYEFELVFNYYEVSFSNDTIKKSVSLIKTTVSPPSGNGSVSTYYVSDNFYSSCLNLIPYPDAPEEAKVKDRLSGSIDIIVSGAEEQLALYIKVNAPATGIVQEKPQYTNIDNGLGIFSSRIKSQRSKKLHAESVTILKNLENGVLKFKL